MRVEFTLDTDVWATPCLGLVISNQDFQFVFLCFTLHIRWGV